MRMNIENKFSAAGVFSTPPPSRKSRPVLASPSHCPMSERKYRSPPPPPLSSKCRMSGRKYRSPSPSLSSSIKLPAGDSPYVRAKHVQLIDKDPSKSIPLFWSAINSGDRVDSALKDMAVVMKQLDRAEEAIEAIKSFRHLCPLESQESLDNLLIELYKRAGRVEEQIEMLKHKLKCVEEGMESGGKIKKIHRFQGKKVHITVDQERARILGNLGWAYLQQFNYGTAEELYRKAQALEPDNNKQCNLAICLTHMNRIPEAKALLDTRKLSLKDGEWDDSFTKSFNRAAQMLTELDPSSVPILMNQTALVSSLASMSTNQVEGDQINKHRSFESPVSRKENWVSAPSPNRSFPKAPMTEPRRGSAWYAVNGDQRTRIFWENGEPETKPVKPKEQSLSANSKPNRAWKKSWADLVEEEEEEQATYCQQNQIDSLNKNAESFGQKEANENHGKCNLSGKSSARRSLCFDEQQEETDSVSKKAWEGGKKKYSAEKYVIPMRRNRLQVLEDITLRPECL